LELQLSDDPAGIAGRVVDSGARTAGPFLVFVVTVAPRRMVVAMTMAIPLPNASFQFPDLPPGDYEVTVWRSSSSPGADTVKRCNETVKVTVSDGAVASIAVRPCP